MLFSAAAAVVLAAMTLTGCSPSIDPAAKADIDHRVGLLQAGGAALPPPTTFMPAPLAAGQWSQYKAIDDKGQPSFITYKIVGEDSGAYWVEILHESYFGADAQKMLIAFGNRMDINQVEIRAASTRDSKGHVNELPPSVMPLLQSSFKGIASSLIISWQGLPQEPAAGPGRPFRRLLPRPQQRAVGPLEEHRRFVVAPGRADQRARPHAGRRPPLHDGAGRLRHDRRQIHLLTGRGSAALAARRHS